MIGTPLAVVKVGGGLLAGPGELRQVAAAIASRRRRGERLLVVVSALKDVTDLLERAAHDVLDPRSGGEIVRDIMQRLSRQHAAMASADCVALQPALDSVERLLTGIRLTGELTDRTRDLLLAHGERLSAPLVAAAVLAAGADARAVSSEEAGLRAVGPFRVGACDLPASAAGLQALQHELHDRVLVLTGFYGVNSSGDVVLFGRGGSDYTAGVVAAGLRADALELWKNVPGFMSADPTVVPGARLLPELSFDEASELGYYGARILHPRCLDPLRGMPVEVSLRSIEAVDVIGTLLVERRRSAGSRVAALAARRRVAVVRVSSSTMVNAPGVAGRILSAMGSAGINIDAVASAMTSLSFSIDEQDTGLARRTLRLLQEQETAGVGSFDVRERQALLGVVGDGVASDPSVGARVLGCLAELGTPVELVSHGPGDVSLSCALSEARLEEATLALHETFFPAAVRA